MLSDLDIYRAAHLMMHSHGGDAELEAAIHAVLSRITETLIVMLLVPFALVGGVWLMDFMHFNMSVAVAVGFIALAGVAAETGVVMLIYLDHALTERRARCSSEGRNFTRDDLWRAPSSARGRR